MSFLPSLCCLLLAAPDAAEIDRLVRQLGSPRFEEREEAVKRLEAVGEPALGALRKAAAGEDVEIRRRARALLESIEGRDYQKLEGAWECVHEGSPRVTVGAGGQVVFDRGTRVALTFVLGPTERPKTIDFQHRGKLFLRGLYALEGDELRLCLPLRDDANRPRAFAAAGDAEAVTLTFRRVPAAREPK